MPTLIDCNADTQANSLFTSLTADAPEIPTIDLNSEQFSFVKDEDSPLYQNVDLITIDQLTEVNLQGNGTFDKMMAAVDLHIQREFKDDRINSAQYAEVYASAITAVLGNATSFLLQKDQSKWNAIQAQMQARIAEIEATKTLVDLERLRVETAKTIFEMQNSGAQYALTKMQVAKADAEYCLTKNETARVAYQIDNLLPAELAIQQYQRSDVMPAQVDISRIQADRILPAEASMKEFTVTDLQPLEKEIQIHARDIQGYNLNTRLPAELKLLQEQIEREHAQTSDTLTDGTTTVSGILGKQTESLDLDVQTKQFTLDNTLDAQLNILKEQYESERAKTLDVRTDSTVIVGSIGKQKDLYNEQINSFVKDAKYKTAKMYLDGWITQKTLDDALVAPTQLQNANVDAVLTSIRGSNAL